MTQLGEKHHHAKLTEEIVKKARELRADGLTFVQINEELGHPVAQSTLEQAIKGHTWRHVE